MAFDLWALGSYPALAERLAPAAADVAKVAGPGRGRLAVDVAAGTGSAAVRLAERGWQVAATDGSTRMIELGRAASTKLGHAIDWHQADLVTQPFDDASQDLVVSSFGLIFAADPAAAIAEVGRLLNPAGRMVVTTWTDDGYMASMTERMMTYLPSALPGGPAPLRWGSVSFLKELLSPGFIDVGIERRTLPWSFLSPAAGRRWLAEVSPAHVAAQNAAGAEAEAMMDAVEEHLAEHADPSSGRVVVEAEYFLVQARRAPRGERPCGR